ncbi:MAG TPA: hypothetical protein VF669_23410 [Tepidisphaeraceae bacterium]|jgi:hypothetical protein
MSISATNPVGRAIDRAKHMTFQPFDLKKWFIIGFCAFLADLGTNSGRFNFNVPGPARAPAPPGVPTPAPAPPDPREVFESVRTWVIAHPSESILAGAAAFLIIVTMALLLTWLSSRGHFMFIHNIATNVAAVVEPWNRFRDLAWSLFLFRLVLLLIGFAAFLLAATVAATLAWPDIRAGTLSQTAGVGIFVGFLILLPIVAALFLIQWGLITFVVPIMYATNQSASRALQEFRQRIIPGNRGAILLVMLLQFVFAIAIAIGQMIIGCVTCCIGLLPYLSSVASLPLLIFYRAYPIYFLQQFDPRYRIIQEPPPPAPPMYGFPVTPAPMPPPATL